MIIQQMSISDQIIAVINDLCQKFGIVIDWTAENALPYIEDLCGRYIQFEIQTSIMWIICIAAVTVLAGIVWAASAIVYANTTSGLAEIASRVSMTVFWIALVLTLIVWMAQVYDIIECCNIPEMAIIEYIDRLIINSQ